MQAAVAVDAGPIGRSKALDDSLQRAHQLAVAQGHAAVTLEHLLFALQDDPDGQAILESSGVGRDKLAADVSAYVGRLAETMPATPGTSPQPGPDLLRILQLAAMAARQSQRRLMDGAIVLAAIIGDGNSPSAGMLKAQGLTFEAVVRVLSQIGQPRQAEIAPAPQRAPLPAPSTAAVAAAPEQPFARPSPTAETAEHMLAGVRARVKQAEPATVPIKAPPKPAAKPVAAPAPPPEPVAALPVAAPAAVEPVAPSAPPQAPPAPAPPPAASSPDTPAEPTQPVARPHQQPLPAAASAPPQPVPDRPGPALAEMRRPPTASPPALPSAGMPPPLPSGASGGARPPLPASALLPPQTPPSRPSALRAEPEPLPPHPRHPQSAPPPAAQPAPPPPPRAPTPLPPPAAVAPPLPPHLAQQVVPQPPPQPVVAQPVPPSPPPQALVPTAALDIVAAAAGLPASVRMGTPVLVEVRIPRDQIDVPRRRTQVQLAGPAEMPIYRVISVRLGTGGVSGIAIEPRSPETVWLGLGRDLDSHDFVWQFVVTPTRAGRFAVTLGVSGRTVSPYGVAGDGTPTTETFAVVVKRAPGGRFKRLLATLTVFGLGAATAVFAGGPLLAMAKAMLASLLK